jgi:quercetin dioxygenase-like cupin family protein
VLIDLTAGDQMGEHRTHEAAVLEVVSGRVALSASGRRVECEPGTLISFDPGESRTVEALEPARVLLVLAPWPGEGHYAQGQIADPLRTPADATVPPLEP